jgi:tetratricopeptide (TPR) repeat protein
MRLFWVIIAIVVSIAAVAAAAYAIDNKTAVTESDNVVDNSVARYRMVLAKDPKNLDARLAIADTYTAAGKPAKAIRELKEIIDNNLGREEAFNRLGSIYEAGGQKRLAEKYYLVAASLAPSDEVSLLALSRLALDRKDYRKAIKYLNRISELRPGLADVHYDLGWAYEGLGRPQSALREYEAALKYVPDYQEAKAGLERVGAKIN